MAWNGSDRISPTVARADVDLQRRTSHFHPFFGILLLALVTIIAIIVIVALLTSNSNQSATPGKTTFDAKIKGNSGASNTKAKRRALLFDEIEKPNVNGVSQNLETPRKLGRIVKWDTHKQSVSNTPTDECLSEILTTVPGDRIVEYSFDEGFDDEFKAALTNTIIISHDDPPDVVELKNAVISARAAVSKLVATGLKASDVLTDMRKEINEVASYREKLESNLELMCAMSDDTDIVRRYVKDCNKQLDEYGARHLSLPESDEELLENMAELRRVEAENDK